MSLTSYEKQCLDDEGYLVLAGFFDDELQQTLARQVERLFAEEGDQAGSEFKQEPGARRLANLVNKGEVFQQVITNDKILECVCYVLGSDIKLSSLNARSVGPDPGGAQPLHCDMAAIPDELGFWVCNTVWMLDDFSTDNGTLRVVPGSHRFNKLPQDVMDDPFAPHPKEILVTAAAGSVIVMNAHLWHSGTENAAGTIRTAVHGFYCRRDKPQQQYQKQLVDLRVQQQLPAELRELLALDDSRNDELCASDLPRSGFLN